LNKFLAGGYETDIISTIYGPGGSGKSNFVMCACVSQAKKGNKVVFIDTEGSFSVERFVQIHGGEKEDIERDFQHILIMNPTSFAEQETAFENLLKWIKSKEISLIIVDSLVILYRLELGDAIKTQDPKKIGDVNRKLANQLRSLNEIARKQKIPVLVTNQVYSSFVKEGVEESVIKEINMVGGDLLKYWSKCLIELQHSYGRRKAILQKHRSLPQKEFSFEIYKSGIRKKGIF
jgi:DNA repair protein RadB